MAVPQPLDLTGPDESPLDSDVGQQLRIAFGDADSLAENLGRGFRRRWYLGYSAVAGINMFHVKHPSRSVPAVDAPPELHRCNSVLAQSTKTTTRRPGSTPSLSL